MEAHQFDESYKHNFISTNTKNGKPAHKTTVKGSKEAKIYAAVSPDSERLSTAHTHTEQPYNLPRLTTGNKKIK